MKILKSLIIVVILISANSLAGNCHNYNAPPIDAQNYNPYPYNRSHYDHASSTYIPDSYNLSYSQPVREQKTYSNHPCRRYYVPVRVPANNNYSLMSSPVNNSNPYFSRNQANPYFPR